MAKLNADGDELLYATYLGGNGGDYVGSLATDATGATVIVGMTTSSDFPVTPGAFSDSYGGGDGDYGDGFVARLSANGTELLYATYLGGSGDDYATALAIDATGGAVVAGATSSDFPIVGGLGMGHGGGYWDAFIAKMNLGDATEVRYPRLRLSTASLERGGALTVTGTGFTPGGTVTLYVDGPGGFVTVTETRTASSSGEVSYAFSTSPDDPPGTYVVSARDEAAAASAPHLYFRVTAPAPRVDLAVTSMSLARRLGRLHAFVEWVDNAIPGGPYPVEGARRAYRYRIEIARDGGPLGGGAHGRGLPPHRGERPPQHPRTAGR